jgi:hypothetical protein
MTRYLLGMTFEGGVVVTPIQDANPEEISPRSRSPSQRPSATPSATDAPGAALRPSQLPVSSPPALAAASGPGGRDRER